MKTALARICLGLSLLFGSAASKLDSEYVRNFLLEKQAQIRKGRDENEVGS